MSEKPRGERAPARRAVRACGVLLATALIAGLVAGIPVLPGIPMPPAAHAAGTAGRLCHDTEASGSFASPTDSVEFKP